VSHLKDKNESVESTSTGYPKADQLVPTEAHYKDWMLEYEDSIPAKQTRSAALFASGKCWQLMRETQSISKDPCALESTGERPQC